MWFIWENSLCEGIWEVGKIILSIHQSTPKIPFYTQAPATFFIVSKIDYVCALEFVYLWTDKLITFGNETFEIWVRKSAEELTKAILRKQGYENLTCDLTFKRYAENFRKNNYAEWVLKREGMKAYHDKVEPYIERDISKIEVGDIIIADGHVLNFQVINPFTGKPTRATLVGFLDLKFGWLVSYDIMLEENIQNIVSTLRNAILKLDHIPEYVYQDNGRAFRGKYFTGSSFLDFQESFEKLIPSYIGKSIENKPAYMKRNQKLHNKIHEKYNYTLTIEQTSLLIDKWLELKHA